MATISIKILRVNHIAMSLHRLVRELERAGDRILRDEVGLSYSRTLVLLAIDIEGAMSQQTLATWLGSTAPAVTGLLRELTADDLVSVQQDERNRRRNTITLTAEGERVIRRARARLDQRFQELLRLADVEEAPLQEALTRIETTMRKASA
ncbi:MarR family transcriptional regulator [Planctomonas sp. JC2975]|uniref:MarR family winged helix-turn-helix transcriptional regulator n=1 Tax=Planctomonas sp. JC2975 TaxID=2729626 RepID=UPI001475B3DD|nr:MarR family transcriptional regulator [Planctomonas sp. JC2975]NNC11097.1 MarR family transcriptional regulator [Planctomonas sp. JC2975]